MTSMTSLAKAVPQQARLAQTAQERQTVLDQPLDQVCRLS